MSLYERSDKELNAKQISLVLERLIGHIDWYGETQHDAMSNINVQVADEVLIELLRGMINSATIICRGWYGNGSANMLNKTIVPMLETYKEMIEDCFLEINETRKELESYKRKSNIGKKVFSIVMYLNSMIREYPHCRIECIKWELFAITVCDGKTAEEIEKKQDEKNNFNFILARPDWFITVK